MARPESGEEEEGYRPVPVEAARQICEYHAKDWAVILANDRRWGRVHSTTFGVEPADKIAAIKAAEHCLDRLGVEIADRPETFEDFRLLDKAEARKRIDDLNRELEAAQFLISELRAELHDLRRPGEGRAMTRREKADFYRLLIERTRGAFEGIDAEDLAEAQDVLMGSSIVDRSRRAELAESVRLARVFFLSLSDIIDDFDRLGGAR